MKTFLKIVSRRKKDLVPCLNEEERKWVLQSLVNITLNYKLTKNYGMYNHVMGL